MSTDRDFDRLSRAWLDLMPDEAPNRAVAAVLEAVESTPQVRRRFSPALWRFPRMNRLSLVLLTGIVIGALAIGALVGSSRNLLNNIITVPTATPATSTVPSTVPIPSSLKHTWISAPRTPDEDAYGYRASLSFSGSNDGWADLVLATGGLLQSTVSLETEDTLRLSSTPATGYCRQGDVGTYRVTLSPGGRRLGLTPEADGCAVRLQALAGDWVETACKVGFAPNPPSVTGCYGDLEAGTYPSRTLNLREPTSARYGSVAITVPDGWANAADENERFYLVPSADYANPDSMGGWWGLFVFGHPEAASSAADCPTAPERGVGHTPQQLIDWIRTRPGVHSTAPQPITIDGHEGLSIDIALGTKAKTTCPWSGGDPFVPLIETNDSVIGAIDLTQRYIFVDIGGGDTALIVINTATASRFDGFVAEAMPVVQSLHFR